MRAALAAIALLVLAGCGGLDTSYGTNGSGSINGGDLITAAWKRDFAARSFTRLSPRLDDCDLLLHLARDRELPDEEACAWLERWLGERRGRQAVLVLRDGAPGAWLCRRWASECDAAATAEPARAEELAAEAARLRAMAQSQDLEDPKTAVGERRTCKLFALRATEPLVPAQVTAALIDDAPPTLVLRSRPDGDDAEVIIDADGQPLVWSRAVGHSRLVIVANATALLDGALVHPAARRLLDALDAELRAHRAAPAAAAVVRVLTPRADAEQSHPDQLAMLFRRLPYAWASWHFLILAVVMLLARAVWLGRIAPGRGRPLERFARHVDALAWHLRGRDAWRGCLDALARHLKREPPPARDATAARAAAGDLFRPAPSATHPVPAPARADQEP